MSTLFTDEQRLLGESLEQFAAGRYSFDQRRERMASAEGYSQEIWQDFAELGWLGLPIAEADGGFGGGLADAAVLMEGFGRMLVLEPYVPTVLFGAQLLSEIGSADQRLENLPKVSDGSRKLCLAHSETKIRWVYSGEQISLVYGLPLAHRQLVQWP